MYIDPKMIRRILAVRLDNIGDVIMLGPALRAIRRAYPEARITLMCSPAGSQAAALMPWIDDVFVLEAVWQDILSEKPIDRQAETNLVDRMRLGKYDAAFIFTSFSQSPYPAAYCAYLAEIPIRVGHSKEFGGRLLTHWYAPPTDGNHQVDRNLALLERVGIDGRDTSMELIIPQAVQSRVSNILLEQSIDSSTPFICVVPGASCAARRYPVEKFAQVVRLLDEQQPYPIVILGNHREVQRLKMLTEQKSLSGRVVSLIGRTSVAEFAEIIHRSQLVIANNSAALHIADAFQRPVVVLYSGTELISQWEPRYSPAKLLNRSVPCSPCYRFECPYHLECLDIPPQEVVEAGLELLGSVSRKSQTAYEQRRN